MEPAPYYTDLAEAPDQTKAVWTTASDGLKLRIAICPVQGAKGVVLLFPGRTELVEKYGRVMTRLAKQGYSSAAIDWRGQGLSDRMLEDRLIGHVGRFRDYQRDVAALVDALHALPGPRYLLAHSMGGAIGLRAVLDGLDVKAAAFSAPMWGIKMPAYQDTLSRLVIRVLSGIGQGDMRAPGTVTHSYLLENSFAGNNLTTDLDEWTYMKRQVEQVPDFALAGPSINWVRQAIVECNALVASKPRDIAILTGLGGDETIVPRKPIEDRMARWPSGAVLHVPGARHELMMESPAKRDRFMNAVSDLFATA